MFCLLFVSLIWGFSFVIIKGSLTSLDSNFVSFARLLLSLLVFIPFIRPAGIRFQDKLQLMLIGSVQFGLMYLAYIAAFRDLPAHVIALLTTTTPIFVSVFADLYAGTIHKAVFLGALLAVAGGAVLQFPDQPFAANVRGVVLVQISNAAFAFGQIAYRKWMVSKPELQRQKHFCFSLCRRRGCHGHLFIVHYKLRPALHPATAVACPRVSRHPCIRAEFLFVEPWIPKGR